ncbi:hypothetical protein C2845_PM14G04210 [Panicum miliaceum]|uniref:Uncharacterized protein n=1 Tax=Panicum miliaceum TaxID=4540 RepID=A0A3L6PS79_PANMI|nr:hypothetical protein C2845_PM14G04210 [Panicum miliaceum]
MPDDVNITLDKKAMYVFAVVGSGLTKRPGSRSTTQGGKPAGSRKKRKKLVRLDKEYIEMKMRNPPPRPYPFLSDEPVRRAMDLELAAMAQKKIDRHVEMCRQYEIQGYADIEYTDPDDDDNEDRINWRPWAYLKEVGLAD